MDGSQQASRFPTYRQAPNSLSIDLKTAYALLLKAYLRQHPHALERNEPVEEVADE